MTSSSRPGSTPPRCGERPCACDAAPGCAHRLWQISLADPFELDRDVAMRITEARSSPGRPLPRCNHPTVRHRCTSVARDVVAARDARLSGSVRSRFGRAVLAGLLGHRRERREPTCPRRSALAATLTEMTITIERIVQHRMRLDRQASANDRRGLCRPRNYSVGHLSVAMSATRRCIPIVVMATRNIQPVAPQ